ncbi:MAG: ISAon1 family transposase [Phocaeicola sp.]
MSCAVVAKQYKLDAEQLQRQYKEHLSNFNEWKQKSHATDYILYKPNMGPNLSIDETSLSNGELYTVLTNRDRRTGDKCLIAMINGTKSDKIREVLLKIPEVSRRKVREITVDMAANMHHAIKRCFPKADITVDRFHVQKLALEGVQKIRIDKRWEALDLENQGMSKAKEQGESYKPEEFENGDTLKQLLARSRYLLFKSREKWNDVQKQRGKILFRLYPEIEQAYNLTHSLRIIFNQNSLKDVARTKLAHWYKEVEAFIATTKPTKDEAKSKKRSNDEKEKPKPNPFHSILNSIESYSDQILNFFNNRATNASAECFNAKLKKFRADVRGVNDVAFFLYRVANIYAK